MGKEIIIIGGGIAGLSAGIYARLNGYNTEILEMHTNPGGQCTAWKRKGYIFDYCVHWLVGSSHGAFYDVWRETGALNDQTRVADLDTYASVRSGPGETLYVYSDIDRWENYLKDLAPEDVKSIEKMCSDMRKASTLTILDRTPRLRRPLDYIRFAMKSWPAMRIFARYSRMSVKEYIDHIGFKSELLNNRLLGFMTAVEGFSAIAFLLTLAWFSQKNAGYPIGGSMPFTLRMADRYRELGGIFSGGCRVDKIIVEDNKAVGVRLSDGTEKRADFIVGASDLHGMIYGMLDGRYTTPELDRAFREWTPFRPIVMVSFGIDRTIETDDHTLQVLAAGEKIGSTQLSASYAVNNYNHDPLITPEGKCVMQLYYDTPYEMWEGMGDGEYRAEKERIEKDAQERLVALYPEVLGHIEVVDVATPLTCVRYTGVWKGAYEGFMPTNKNIGRGMRNYIRGFGNFYLAGQWLFPGGGLPPAAQSGKWAIQMICHKDKKKFRVG